MGTLKKNDWASLAKAYILKIEIDRAHGEMDILWRVFKA